jgi:hypothetical protein
MCSHDVGLHEFSRPVNRAVNVRFCGQVHHPVRFVFIKNLLQSFPIADVQLNKMVAVRIHHSGERLHVAGVSQLIHIDDPVTGFMDKIMNQV